MPRRHFGGVRRFGWCASRDLRRGHASATTHPTEGVLMELNAAVALVAEKTGMTPSDFDRPVEKHDGWHFGERVRVVYDSPDDMGPFEGDLGYVVIEEVGAPEHGNVRIDLAVITDGTN